MVLTAPEQHINYQRIEKAIRFLEENFKSQPDLDVLAEKVHLSPFHFQRIFTEWAGISPKKFLQYLTVEFLKERLRRSKSSIVDVAESAGLSSQSRVYDLFTNLEGVTPQEYRLSGEGINISYGFHFTPFGLALVGVTQRGVCWLSFINEEHEKQAAFIEMRMHWNKSVLVEDLVATGNAVDLIFDTKSPRPRLFMKGTSFQLKVWEALLRIKPGEITTYQDIAVAINNPKAVQAVGSAVGSNHIAFLIPCHRVIRKDGVLGEYRWNSARKKSLIGWEMARSAS
ncbi:MAG TPA: methylated-DNA--[protein]-cysteine S-methyltransferase [Chryseosolibacter sp.]|nr:methylated-DNA--[protein]-cysteine S-methyltransferase [Chryseosolibacter sp.]